MLTLLLLQQLDELFLYELQMKSFINQPIFSKTSEQSTIKLITMFAKQLNEFLKKTAFQTSVQSPLKPTPKSILKPSQDFKTEFESQDSPYNLTLHRPSFLEKKKPDSESRNIKKVEGESPLSSGKHWKMEILTTNPTFQDYPLDMISDLASPKPTTSQRTNLMSNSHQAQTHDETHFHQPQQNLNNSRNMNMSPHINHALKFGEATDTQSIIRDQSKLVFRESRNKNSNLNLSICWNTQKSFTIQDTLDKRRFYEIIQSQSSNFKSQNYTSSTFSEALGRACPHNLKQTLFSPPIPTGSNLNFSNFRTFDSKSQTKKQLEKLQRQKQKSEGKLVKQKEKLFDRSNTLQLSETFGKRKLNNTQSPSGNEVNQQNASASIRKNLLSPFLKSDSLAKHRKSHSCGLQIEKSELDYFNNLLRKYRADSKTSEELTSKGIFIPESYSFSQPSSPSEVKRVQKYKKVAGDAAIQFSFDKNAKKLKVEDAEFRKLYPESPIFAKLREFENYKDFYNKNLSEVEFSKSRCVSKLSLSRKASSPKSTCRLSPGRGKSGDKKSDLTLLLTASRDFQSKASMKNTNNLNRENSEAEKEKENLDKLSRDEKKLISILGISGTEFIHRKQIEKSYLTESLNKLDQESRESDFNDKASHFLDYIFQHEGVKQCCNPGFKIDQLFKDINQINNIHQFVDKLSHVINSKITRLDQQSKINDQLPEFYFKQYISEKGFSVNKEEDMFLEAIRKINVICMLFNCMNHTIEASVERHAKSAISTLALGPLSILRELLLKKRFTNSITNSQKVQQIQQVYGKNGLLEKEAKEKKDFLHYLNESKTNNFEIMDYDKNVKESDYIMADKLVSRLKFFTGFEQEIRIKILKMGKYAYYRKGEVIFREGDLG
jgi:hypothetical protein